MKAPRLERRVVVNELRTNLPVVLAKPPDEPTEPTPEERLALAEAREDAVRIVLKALITSLRPFGFDRKRFMRCIREEAEEVPASGPRSVQHAVLLSECRRVLREAR